VRTLHIKKGAPETPRLEPTDFWANRNTEDMCISPGLWGMYPNDPYWHGKFRCHKTGSIKTDRGMMCVTHAQVYARRGWINADLLRKILIARAEERAERTKARLKCLRAGKCL
jgi:hypothetical protein